MTLVALQNVVKKVEVVFFCGKKFEVVENGVVANPTSTLADEFIEHTQKKWWNDEEPGLIGETFYCEK